MVKKFKDNMQVEIYEFMHINCMREIVEPALRFC